MSLARVLASLLAPLLFVAPSSAQEKMTLGGVGSGSPIHWPAYIAIEKGFFRKRGLEVEYIQIGRAHV